MPLPKTLPAAILETILTHLATLFLTGAVGDTAAARHAAAQMLAAYNPENEAELRLAASIIGFSFHALEALSQATGPDLSLTRVLRLRGSAVSLSRESAKAERRLAQLQKARQHSITAPQAEPKPAANTEDTATVAAAAKAKGLTWTQAYQQRQRDIRIAASRKKAQARSAPRPNPVADHRPMAQAV
jgi:hypothetical protein